MRYGDKPTFMKYIISIMPKMMTLLALSILMHLILKIPNMR